MRSIFFFAALMSLGMLVGCAERTAPNTRPMPSASPSSPSVSTASPLPTSLPTPKNGDYPAKGKVTKINNELGSVELDHEDVPGLMPPMIMEFYVDDKSVLKQIAVGDKVDFVIRYKDGQETISKITKAK